MSLSKLRTLADSEGYDTILEFLEDNFNSGYVAGICMRDTCDYVSYVEPDCDEGWCELCLHNTVESGINLAMRTI